MFWHVTGKTSCKFKGLLESHQCEHKNKGPSITRPEYTFFACGQINELCVLIGCRWGQPLLQLDSQYPEASHSKASVVSAFVNQPHIPKLVNWCTNWNNLSQQFLLELWWTSLHDFQPNLKLYNLQLIMILWNQTVGSLIEPSHREKKSRGCSSINDVQYSMKK
jgi:hypothetical protein